MPEKKKETKKVTESKAAEANEASGAAITDTYGGSPVTSNAPETESTESQINLADAKITVPKAAIEDAPATAEESTTISYEDFEKSDNSFAQRAEDASIGLIRVDGLDFRYVGRSPSHPEENAEHPTGLKLSSMNTTFTPLSEVAFDPTIRVKVGDEFFFPQNATSWGDVVNSKGEPLVPREANKEATRARYEARYGKAAKA